MSEKMTSNDVGTASEEPALQNGNFTAAAKKKFEKLCKDAGLCDTKGIQRMMKIYEISLLKESSPELSQQTESMERAIDQIQKTYMQTVRVSETAEACIDAKEAEIQEQAQEKIRIIESEKDEAVELQHEAEQKLQDTVKENDRALREWERKYNDLIVQNKRLTATASQLQTELKKMSKSAHAIQDDGMHSENAEDRIVRLVEQMQTDKESEEAEQYRETQIELKAKLNEMTQKYNDMLDEMTQKYNDMTEKYNHVGEEKDLVSKALEAVNETVKKLTQENKKLKDRNAILEQKAARTQEMERLNLQMQSIIQARHT